MTSKQFYTLWGEALATNDRDAYVSDWVNSTLLLPPEVTEIPSELVEELGRIWDAAHRPIPEIRHYMGLTQAKFSERFCVGRRTVETWEARGSCPDYLRLLIQQQVGLVLIPD